MKPQLSLKKILPINYNQNRTTINKKGFQEKNLAWFISFLWQYVKLQPFSYSLHPYNDHIFCFVSTYTISLRNCPFPISFCLLLAHLSTEYCCCIICTYLAIFPNTQLIKNTNSLKQHAITRLIWSPACGFVLTCLCLCHVKWFSYLNLSINDLSHQNTMLIAISPINSQLQFS